MTTVKIFILFFISSVITGCGFHLRGNQDLSSDLPEVKVQGINHYSDYGRELIRALTAAKVNVSDTSMTVLNVSSEAFSKRVISVDSAGRANQYELRHDISYSLVKVVPQKQKTKGKITQPQVVDLIPAQTISEKRDYLFDANAVLAAEQEERRLKKDMIQASLIQFVRRLQFSLRAAKKKSKQSELKSK